MNPLQLKRSQIPMVVAPMFVMYVLCSIFYLLLYACMLFSQFIDVFDCTWCEINNYIKMSPEDISCIENGETGGRPAHRSDPVHS